MPRSRSAKYDTHDHPWRLLTWATVEDWAGLRAVERGREYCRSGRVSWLARTDEGELLGCIRGGTRYRVRVRLEAGILRSRCTCPLLDPGCKHAVAAVLAYLDALRHSRDVPTAEGNDPAWPFFDEVSESRSSFDEDSIEAHRAAIDAALVCPVPSACESVLPRLRLLRSQLLADGRADEWDEYEANLATTHARQQRMAVVLARVKTRRIIPA